MKKLFKVGKEFFDNKATAKAYRNELEGYTPVVDKKTGLVKPHVFKNQVKRGPDHWKGSTK